MRWSNAGSSGSPRAGWAQAQSAHSFDIPAKPARAAMNDIVRVAGIDVVFAETTAASRRGNPVRGSLTTGQAVAALLSGTGLSYRFLVEADGMAQRTTGLEETSMTVIAALLRTSAMRRRRRSRREHRPRRRPVRRSGRSCRRAERR